MHDLHIDPVSRIEGHAKITLVLDDDGRVDDARFHVTEFRGFEEFCRGRPVWEMPALTARTCGICPVSHLLASAKAGDAIMAVRVPPTATKLRRLANLGQILQSHALSYFHLSAPDLLLGMDADPAVRNVFGLMREHPDLTRRGIRLRQFGQQVVEAVAGRRIHGAGIVPGGVAAPLGEDRRRELRGWIDEATETVVGALALYEELLARHQREAMSFGVFPSLFLGLCGADGTWEHHEGRIRVVDHDGTLVADGLEAADYRDFLGEHGSDDSYLKSPYYSPRLRGDDPWTGVYRVGPLARLNISDRMGSPMADERLAVFKQRHGGVALSSFAYHEARLIEMLACVEQAAALLDDPAITDSHVRASAGVNALRGVGVSEAPRGTLFHDYRVDDDGTVTAVNMIIATGQNNLAMNATVRQIAREFVDGIEVPEPALNRIEAGIRAYDPCLSCSTHALGEMPMVVEVRDGRGALLAEVTRD